MRQYPRGSWRTICRTVDEQAHGHWEVSDCRVGSYPSCHSRLQRATTNKRTSILNNKHQVKSLLARNARTFGRVYTEQRASQQSPTPGRTSCEEKPSYIWATKQTSGCWGIDPVGPLSQGKFGTRTGFALLLQGFVQRRSLRDGIQMGD